MNKDTCISQELLKVEPNSTYVIECEFTLSNKTRQNIEAYLLYVTQDPSIKFILLDRGMKIAKSKSEEPKSS